MAGNNKGSRRRFGAVRQLPSGRWQVRYPDPQTGKLRPDDRTYPTKRDAEVALSTVEADITRQEWTDPDAGKVNFKVYADSWVAEHPKLADRTRDLYEGLLRLHLAPTFAGKDLRDIKEPHVRTWRKARLDAGTGPVTVAKAYRLLRAILNTAVDDGLIKRNPCRIKGGGDESSPERPTLTVSQVYALSDRITPRYRALVLLAAFTSLRFGELAGLRKGDIDLDRRIIRVRRAQSELRNGSLPVKAPKSAAGVRQVAFPESIAPEVKRHLEWFAERDDDGLVFVGPQGGRLRRNNFNRVWKRAFVGSRVPYVHFHDLRHTGNTIAASTGASLKELMGRMGHASTRAAMIYQHRTDERDREIADAMDREIKRKRSGKRAKAADRGQAASESGDANGGASGTNLARGL